MTREKHGPKTPSDAVCDMYFDNMCFGCPIAMVCNAEHPPIMTDEMWKTRDRAMDKASRPWLKER